MVSGSFQCGAARCAPCFTVTSLVPDAGFLLCFLVIAVAGAQSLSVLASFPSGQTACPSAPDPSAAIIAAAANSVTIANLFIFPLPTEPSDAELAAVRLNGS